MEIPITHTLYPSFIDLGRSPVVTGSSVIGVKYQDGIMLCADMQASYGSSRKFKNFSHIARINDKTALGFLLL